MRSCGGRGRSAPAPEVAGIPRAHDGHLGGLGRLSYSSFSRGQTLCLQPLEIGAECFIHLLAGSEISLRIPAGFLFLCHPLLFGGLLLVFVDVYHT